MQNRKEQTNCNEVRISKGCEKLSHDKKIENVEINIEYADDIKISTTDKKVIEHIK